MLEMPWGRREFSVFEEQQGSECHWSGVWRGRELPADDKKEGKDQLMQGFVNYGRD